MGIKADIQLTSAFLDDVMSTALAEAAQAASDGEVPVGAVVVDLESGKRFGAHNLTETQQDPSAHAEILAIRRAAKELKNWRLENSLLVVTLEPCSMCAGVIKLARIPVVAFGLADPRAGAMGSLYDISQDQRTGAPPRVISNVRAADCRKLLQDFFGACRDKED